MEDRWLGGEKLLHLSSVKLPQELAATHKALTRTGKEFSAVHTALHTLSNRVQNCKKQIEEGTRCTHRQEGERKAGGEGSLSSGVTSGANTTTTVFSQVTPDAMATSLKKIHARLLELREKSKEATNAFQRCTSEIDALLGWSEELSGKEKNSLERESFHHDLRESKENVPKEESEQRESKDNSSQSLMAEQTSLKKATRIPSSSSSSRKRDNIHACLPIVKYLIDRGYRRTASELLQRTGTPTCLFPEVREEEHHHGTRCSSTASTGGMPLSKVLLGLYKFDFTPAKIWLQEHEVAVSVLRNNELVVHLTVLEYLYQFHVEMLLAKRQTQRAREEKKKMKQDQQQQQEEEKEKESVTEKKEDCSSTTPTEGIPPIGLSEEEALVIAYRQKISQLTEDHHHPQSQLYLEAGKQCCLCYCCTTCVQEEEEEEREENNDDDEGMGVLVSRCLCGEGLRAHIVKYASQLVKDASAIGLLERTARFEDIKKMKEAIPFTSIAVSSKRKGDSQKGGGTETKTKTTEDKGTGEGEEEKEKAPSSPEKEQGKATPSQEGDIKEGKRKEGDEDEEAKELGTSPCCSEADRGQVEKALRQVVNASASPFLLQIFAGATALRDCLVVTTSAPTASSGRSETSPQRERKNQEGAGSVSGLLQQQQRQQQSEQEEGSSTLNPRQSRREEEVDVGMERERQRLDSLETLLRAIISTREERDQSTGSYSRYSQGQSSSEQRQRSFLEAQAAAAAARGRGRPQQQAHTDPTSAEEEHLSFLRSLQQQQEEDSGGLLAQEREEEEAGGGLSSHVSSKCRVVPQWLMPLLSSTFPVAIRRPTRIVCPITHREMSGSMSDPLDQPVVLPNGTVLSQRGVNILCQQYAAAIEKQKQSEEAQKSTANTDRKKRVRHENETESTTPQARRRELESVPPIGGASATTTTIVSASRLIQQLPRGLVTLISSGQHDEEIGAEREPRQERGGSSSTPSGSIENPSITSPLQEEGSTRSPGQRERRQAAEGGRPGTPERTSSHSATGGSDTFHQWRSVIRGAGGGSSSEEIEELEEEEEAEETSEREERERRAGQAQQQQASSSSREEGDSGGARQSEEKKLFRCPRTGTIYCAPKDLKKMYPV